MVSSRMHQLTWLLVIVSVITTITCKGVAETIEATPISNPKVNGAEYVEGAFKRSQKHNNSHFIPLTPKLKRLNLSKDHVNMLPPGRHEYAVVGLKRGVFLGVRATMNVWNPQVTSPEVTFSQIWLQAGTGENTNTLEAGWMVDTVSRPSNEAKLFIFYTIDNYRTRCYNYDCGGFVKVANIHLPNTVLHPVSTYGGQQHETTIAIEKDPRDGNWWLRIEGVNVGFWPKEKFTSLRDHADTIFWGGEIVNTGRFHHTKTQMGSGRFPIEGFGKASYFHHLAFLDAGFNKREPQNLEKQVTRPQCYDLLLNVDPPGTSGVNFYYGGPGFSPSCRI